IEALEGLEMKEGDDFPQGDKTLRKEDHQAFIREFIFDVHEGKYRILDVIPKEKTVFPPECKFACPGGWRGTFKLSSRRRPGPIRPPIRGRQNTSQPLPGRQ